MEIRDTEAEVCKDILARQQFGLRKYGRSVANNPLTEREWLQHAYEESLDLPIYLKRLMQQMDARGTTGFDVDKTQAGAAN